MDCTAGHVAQVIRVVEIHKSAAICISYVHERGRGGGSSRARGRASRLPLCLTGRMVGMRGSYSGSCKLDCYKGLSGHIIAILYVNNL